MADELITLVHDVITNKVIERATTAQEKADLKISYNEAKAAEKFLLAQSVARASALAKLADLGLTAEEIAAL